MNAERRRDTSTRVVPEGSIARDERERRDVGRVGQGTRDARDGDARERWRRHGGALAEEGCDAREGILDADDDARVLRRGGGGGERARDVSHVVRARADGGASGGVGGGRRVAGRRRVGGEGAGDGVFGPGDWRCERGGGRGG